MRPLRRGRTEFGFNMTPMIDVVFLLIIFFLVSSHLAKQEVQTELDLPRAATGRETDEEENVRRVVLNVLPPEEGRADVMVAGRRMPVPEAAGLIRFERDRSDQPLEIRLRVDRLTPYAAVEPLMLACAKEGVWKVTFAVTPE